jgi:hypothetical protein
MKPDWDKLMAEFEGSSVLVGDVDCTVESELCQKWEVRGYPTIKYWTPGNDGKPEDYSKGRDYESLKAHADSLRMACSVADLSNCDEKEKGYITKWQAKDKAAVEKELKRLEGMKEKKMAPKQKKFLHQRINILGQL